VHGQFYQDLQRTTTDKEKSLAWLSSSGLKESLIIAGQDQALNMCYHQNIMKQPNDSKRRMCYNAEHIKHTVVGCTNLAPSEYSNIYNKVSGYIHWTICKHMGLEVTNRYYEYIPERVININGTIVMWDAPVITD
jgi:hypothetical protein